MATITIPRLGSWLLALVLSGCGGGDFQFDAGADDTPAESAAPSAPPPAAGRDRQHAEAAAAVASAADGESILRIRRQPQAAEVAEGELVQFGVDLEGPSAVASVTYQWLRDEQPIDGETGPVLRLRANAADHLARISVTVRAGRRSVHSDAAVLRVD